MSAAVAEAYDACCAVLRSLGDDDDEQRDRIGNACDVLWRGLSAEERHGMHDHTRAALHWLVDRRQSARSDDGRWTLMISNKDAAELRRRFRGEGRDSYDPRTESRLRQLLVRRADGTGIHEIRGFDMRGEAI